LKTVFFKTASFFGIPKKRRKTVNRTRRKQIAGILKCRRQSSWMAEKYRPLQHLRKPSTVFKLEKTRKMCPHFVAAIDFLFQRLKPTCQVFGAQKMLWKTENPHPKNCALSKSLDAENLRKAVKAQTDRAKKPWPKLQTPTFAPPKTEGRKRFYKFKNRLSPNKPETEIMLSFFW
jgi:hypothetical protein